jgi:hypothetical protein
MEGSGTAYFKVLSLHLSGGTEETLSEERWSLGQELNPGPTEYEAEVLLSAIALP